MKILRGSVLVLIQSTLAILGPSDDCGFRNEERRKALRGWRSAALEVGGNGYSKDLRLETG